MASRIAASSLRASASRLRPQAVSAIPRALAARGMSTNNQPPPEQKAAELVNKLPSSNLVTKTGSVVLGSGLLAAAISNELYIVNEETVILAGFVVLATFIAKSIREPYKQWAETQIQKIKNILDSSRAEHTQAVKERIQSVEQKKDVVDITKALFAIAKDTARLENEAFVQKQKVALASEIKQVLDSWIRFEAQEKEQEQQRLVKAVIENVLKDLSDDKVQKDILAGAVSEIEQLVKSKAI